MLEIIYDTKASASHHMQVDRELVMRGGEHPQVRFYEWERFCVTAGMFSNPDSLLDLQECCTQNIEIAKRPTGGGVLFHGADLAFSVFLPKGLMQGTVEECCKRINTTVRTALSPFLLLEKNEKTEYSSRQAGLCMSQVTACDLVWNGKKIGGCAQRKTRHGILHQTSLFLTSPDWPKISLCVKEKEKIKEMQQICVPLDQLVRAQISRKIIQMALAESFLSWRI